jgi:hypothetical protein
MLAFMIELRVAKEAAALYYVACQADLGIAHYLVQTEVAKSSAPVKISSFFY